VRRVDEKQRRFRDIMREDLFEPLGMQDSSVGVRADLRERHIIPHFLQPLPFGHPSRGNYGKDGAFQEEEAEMPWVGCIASVPDMYRFAEMLRRGGELDGARVLSPAMVDKAATNYTGDAPNGMFGQMYHSLGWEQPPACLGLGLVLRGGGIYHHHYGTLASPGTFGSMGAGSTVFWVDPERQMSFVCLRAGVIPEGGSIECFQRLSDMALSAAI
jgi:CubicO group peptidase (beta-lactamase class C family)